MQGMTNYKSNNQNLNIVIIIDTLIATYNNQYVFE